MRTLPAQGGSDGTWGDELNDFLSVAHDPTTGHLSILTYDGDVLVYEGEVVTEYVTTYQ